ncbi:MAG: endonuclease, partial [Chlorobi bacterium]|nr:endonuclease [Chlorobiota bacterium]
MKKILFKFGLSLNWIFAVLLIFSDLSVFVSPDIIPYVALLGLFFPFLVLINLLFLFFKIFSGSKYFLISLFALLLSYNRIKDSYAFGNKKVVKALINPVKVMSYNVRLFDLYNWTGNNCGDSIVNLIKKENPDILCLQEFYSSDKKNYREVIIKSLG